jgi:hypothetical protein
MLSTISDIKHMLRFGFINYQKVSLKEFFNVCFLILILPILVILIKNALTNIFDFQFPINKALELIKKDYRNQGFLKILVILIIPIIEELGFRLPLIFTKISFSFLVTMLALILIGIITNSSIYFYNNWFTEKIILLFSIFCLSYLTLKNNFSFQFFLSEFWSKNPKIIFYSLLFLFSFLHALNFQISIGQLFLIPLLTLNQTIYGILFAFLRLRLGVFYSILLHVFINSVGFVF